MKTKAWPYFGVTLRLLLSALILAGLGFGLTQSSSTSKPSIWRYRMPGASTNELDGCLRNIKNLVIAVKLFTYNEKRRPLTLAEVCGSSDPFLKTLPACPTAGRDTYSDGYQVFELETVPEDSLHPTQGFLIACAGANHSASRVPPDYPRFDLREGFLSGLK